jgi:hypothetical protein
LVMYITRQILFSGRMLVFLSVVNANFLPKLLIPLTESETAIYNLVVSNKLRNNLLSKASLLIQALFLDFRDVGFLLVFS